MKVLDTDTCIGILKGVPSVVESWRGCNERCALPSMVIGELFFGAANSRNPSAEAERVNRFVDIYEELKPTRSLLQKFGEIKAELQKTGELLPDADLLIAATALDAGTTLVTGNIRHFSRISGLSLENWFSKSCGNGPCRMSANKGF